MEMVAKKSKILVVDDEPTNLKLLREILRHEYALVFARSGEEMLRFAVEGPDLILLDIMMPDMDGYEACACLKANEATREIPVIFVTAKIEMEDEVRGLSLGAVDYITKPVQGAIVRARVKTHLQLHHARKVIAQQNEELRKAAQLREDVEQIVRHDLKMPLNAIIGLPGVLIAGWKLDAKKAEPLQLIEDAGFRMLEMINRSHDLYKMERGIYQVSFKPVDILVVLRRVLVELQQVITYKLLSVEMVFHGRPVIAEDVFMVSGEELLCHSMLGNILKNAVEASSNHGSLRIIMETCEQALIRIGNQGSVPVEIRANFFDKYVTFGKKQGVGLGTYSAKLIATTLGGQIHLDSSIEGETFIEILLPNIS